MEKRVHLVGALVALAFSCWASPASAATPPENIPLGSEPSSCSTESSAECEHWAIGQLDAARADVGLGAYALPSDFTSLSADRQLLILTDLDRTAYGETPVYGLNTNLSEAAQAGVRGARDPSTPTAGGPWKGFGSDWASMGALIGYYMWMYDDGYGSPNYDCPSPGAQGCWGHRRVILGEAVTLPQPQLMGAAAGSAGRDAGSALIISSDATTTSYYTWAEAQKEGAGVIGSGEETKPPPKEEPPVVVPPETPAKKEAPAPSSPPSGAPPATTQPAGVATSSAGTPPASSPGGAAGEQITVLLGEHLLPPRSSARIAAVLKRGEITLDLPAGLRGTLLIDCYADSPGRLMVAKGSRRLGGTGEAVTVTLTRAGTNMLRRQGRVSLTLDARLVGAGGTAISVSRSLVLTR